MHLHYCTECLNPITCPALQDGYCEDSFLSVIEEICQTCWETLSQESEMPVVTSSL